MQAAEAWNSPGMAYEPGLEQRLPIGELDDMLPYFQRYRAGSMRPHDGVTVANQRIKKTCVPANREEQV